MNHLARTIVQWVTSEANSVDTARFVLPSYPAPVLLQVGKELEEWRIRLHERKAAFVYGVARRLVEEWESSGSAHDRSVADQVRANGWCSEGDNLTALRNRLRDESSDDLLLVVIAGYDHLDDRASLRDFYHLGERQVWEVRLGRSFKDWVKEALQAAGVEPVEAGVDAIADVLAALYAHGLADLPSISRYLETLDLSGACNSVEAVRSVLGRLDPFGLPRMASLATARGKKTFADYIAQAQEFFNYSRFLEPSARRNAAERIGKYRSAAERREPAEGELGEYRSTEDLLDSLQRYVETRSEEDRKLLLTADFPFILDGILGHKEKPLPNGDGKNKPKVRRLSGLPPEVFLRAVWLTLRDYVEERSKTSANPEDGLERIELRSQRFSHRLDLPEEEDEDGSRGGNDRAQAFLTTVLGGLDCLLENHVTLQLGDGGVVALASRLCPGPEAQIAYARVARGDPYLAFEVEIFHQEGSLRRTFQWRLPENHQCYLLAWLIKWAYGWFARGTSGLPAFAIPHMPELFLMQDEDDVNRLVDAALRSPNRLVVDLLGAPGIDRTDPVFSSLMSLSSAYQGFLLTARKEGLFTALERAYDGLRSAYTDACERFLRDAASSALGELLFKTFLLFDRESVMQALWEWQGYADAFVATPLHPAVLDMLRHQHVFLCESFSTYASEALHKVELRVRPFAEARWDGLADLARLHRPLFGTLKDSAGALDSEVRSYGYIHLVGHCRRAPTGVTARLLLERDADEDGDEVADEDLFRETRASRLVTTVLLDFRDIHCHAEDGLTVGAYCGAEVQPLIAGIDGYLKAALEARGDAPYSLRLVLFTRAQSAASVERWLEAWRERWQAAELSGKRAHYANCTISIACRVVPEDGTQQRLASLLQSTPLDVLFFFDFVAEGESRLEPLHAGQQPADTDYRKFPVLEKACCSIVGGGLSFQRERVLSNPRFALGSLHAEVMARLTRRDLGFGKRHAVVSAAGFLPWCSPIDAGHRVSGWVVCVDRVVDERLLRASTESRPTSRDIIGFGTGVGAHGESNYTISTEQLFLTDVKKRTSSQLALLFDSWGPTVRDRVAESLVQEAAEMAGLSVVKATGPSQYVRDYVSYACVRKLLTRHGGDFCDDVVSLDAYRHWFDDADGGMRPDLLRLRAKIVNGYFQIEAQIVECKLGQRSEAHLGEARSQVEAGVKRLSSCLRPRRGPTLGLFDRPDQRYWWMQLHRLIASRGSTTMARKGETMAALERLSDGYFDISWRAAVVAVWTDFQGGGWRLEEQWEMVVDGETGQSITVPALALSPEYIPRVCLEGLRDDLLSAGTAATYRWGRTPAEDERAEGGRAEPGVSVEGGGAQPGDEVEERNSCVAEAQAGGGAQQQERRVPARILLGTTTSGAASGRAVHWEFGHGELPNRHILIFGASGTGKTYSIQALLCELAKAGQNSVIVDYTNGFTNQQLEEVARRRLQPSQHVVRRRPLPINPFRRQRDLIDGEPIEDDPAITAQRVAGVFAEVYLLGEQQKSALYTAIRDGVAQEGDSFNLLRLMKRLEALAAAGGVTGNAASTVASKIRPFVDMNPFGQEDPESWEKLFNDDESRCHVIQLAGFSRDMQRLITEFSLIDLYRYYRTRGSKDQPRVIVLDEVQNLDHSLESPLGQLLTEGRKFGVSLILATQSLSNLTGEERDRLFQASHKLFFKPADTELKSFAQIIASSTGEQAGDWEQRLSSLSRGECYSVGPSFNESSGRLEARRYFRIRITPLSERS